MAKVKRTATYGTPFLLQRRKTAGACLVQASEYSIRDPANSQQLPDDQADVRMAALMTWLRPPMPAF